MASKKPAPMPPKMPHGNYKGKKHSKAMSRAKSKC